MFTDVVILAGGFGERLWPASRPDFPKQFMTLGGGMSFFQYAVVRALALRPSGKIIVVTRDGLQDRIAESCAMLTEKVSSSDADKIRADLIVVAEPFPKHTTAPVILSSILVRKFDPDSDHSMIVLTSDHIIEPVSAFAADAEKAFVSASKNHIVTFGIQPYEPSTGYGYIMTGDEEEGNSQVYRVDEFREKPDRQTAERYIASGNCRWNSGMFAFRCGFFESELKRCAPEIYDAFSAVADGAMPEISSLRGIRYIAPWREMIESYTRTPAVAIDKSVAEKTRSAYSVLASFSWDDVGSWDSFEKHCDNKTENGILVESSECFIYSDIPVAVCGLDGITVVIKNNKALVMRKGASDLVRKAVRIENEKEGNV